MKEKLKKLLGDKYKDDLQPEDIQKELLSLVESLNNSLDDANSTIESQKKIISERNSEIAQKKKELKDKMTEDERKAQEKLEKEQALLEQLETLKKENAITKNFGEFVKLGYSEDLAKATAEALYAGDHATVFKNQQAFLKAREESLKAELLKKQKTPPSGSIKDEDKTWKDYTMAELNELQATNPTEYNRILNTIK